MIDFNTEKPIYRQIIDFAFSQIMIGQWSTDERIPSVRELSVGMSVNTHTVLKAFEYLQQKEIIYPRRGMGFYLTESARQRVADILRGEFFDTTLKNLKREMTMLGITAEEVARHLNEK